METLTSFQTALLAIGASVTLVAAPVIAVRALFYLIARWRKVRNPEAPLSNDYPLNVG